MDNDGLIAEEKKLSFSPELISNSKKGTIWENLKQELLRSNHFKMAVAFISADMLAPLKLVLSDLKRKKVSGEILTSTYLGFNSPEVFLELLKLSNVTVRVSKDAMHAKGYLFEYEKYQSAIIGSANFTRNALLRNVEWMLKVNSVNNSYMTKSLEAEFKNEWENADVLDSKWILQYQKSYSPPIKNKVQERVEINPNSMQKTALKELQKMRENHKKALVISATGTGKTYLAAFDVLNAQPKKFLFIAHREQILRKSKESFQKILKEDSQKFGIYSGNLKQLRVKYLFATVQTLNKNLDKFKENEFDYILIDEAHHSGAKTYLKIFDYFKPKFFLGITATPERNDDFNIFKLFDYNIAYEIRLKDALKEKMLTPFHYIGISDYEYQGELVSDKTPLKYLVSDRRVAYILKQLNYYEDNTQKVYGLVFCSQKKEAYEIAEKLTHAGKKSIALTNDSTVKDRQKAILRLEKGEVEYIVTVDIFNEGIDIPKINQVVFLRNTNSSIIFTQQLGRGLRKAKNKNFVTVLDFIGNYQNNYLIPMALSGDNSYLKDNVKDDLLRDVLDISTINFAEIPREKIYSILDKVKLDAMINLKKAYHNLKNKIDKVPFLIDFKKIGEISAEVFAQSKTFNNYAEFLSKMGENFRLTSLENKWLTFVTKELMNGIRKHELLLLRELLVKSSITEKRYNEILLKENCYLSKDVLKSVIDILSLHFFEIKVGKELKSKQYGEKPLVTYKNKAYHLNPKLHESLLKKDFYLFFKDVIDVGLLNSDDYDSKQKFTHFKRYTRKDVCRLLNWEKDVSAPMYGYRVGQKDCPIFITLKKDEGKKNGSLYQNNLDSSKLTWYTRSPRSFESDEVKRLLSGKIKLYVFMKQDNRKKGNFYNLGEAKIIEGSAKEILLKDAFHKVKKVVQFSLELKQPLSIREQKIMLEG